MKKSLIIAAIITSVLVSANSASFAKMTPEAHRYYQSACEYENNHKYRQALEELRKALSISGEDALLYTKIGGLYAEIGEWDKAIEAYEQSEKLRPNDAFIHISLGNILQQKQYYLFQILLYLN